MGVELYIDATQEKMKMSFNFFVFEPRVDRIFKYLNLMCPPKKIEMISMVSSKGKHNTNHPSTEYNHRYHHHHPSYYQDVARPSPHVEEARQCHGTQAGVQGMQGRGQDGGRVHEPLAARQARTRWRRNLPDIIEQ